MMAEEQRSRLGRGLSALLGDENEDYAALDRVRASRDVPIAQLRPNPYQPRHDFDETAIEELVESIRSRGVLQPLLVRRVADQPETYEIVAGERRWRAAQKAQLHDVPVIIKDFTDAEALEAAIIENIQRQDLNPVEEARGYRRLIEEFRHTQGELGSVVGKSRSHIANLLRLLQLPDTVQTMLAEGRISMGHARALVTAADPEALAQDIIKRGLTVRQAETFAKGAGNERRTGPRRSRVPKDADTEALEGDLSAALGLKVNVNHHGETGGEVRIRYRTLEQLDEICRRLCQTGMGAEKLH